MSELKGLKIKDAVQGKVLTTDENGVVISSNVDVNDIASANELVSVESRVSQNETAISDLDGRTSQNETDISNLDGRIAELENNVQDIANAVEDINGEIV